MTKLTQTRCGTPSNQPKNTIEKCPEMSQLMEREARTGHIPEYLRGSFPELGVFRGFHGQNNEAFGRERDIKRRKGPRYRKINRYYKSIQRYKKERARRKRAYQLWDKGFTYPQIAEKLGVSERTVLRDIHKVRPYYMRQLRSLSRQFQEERRRELTEKMEGLSLSQRFSLLTDEMIKRQNLFKIREYHRHSLVLTIDMDDITEGCPSITQWPKHWSGYMPVHIVFKVQTGGRIENMGRITLRNAGR